MGAARKREPASATKFAAGLLPVSLGYLLLLPAAFTAATRGVRVSPMWLTGLFLLHTFGASSVSARSA
jgi:POT family proton-dependent oligopeptide transporter